MSHPPRKPIDPTRCTDSLSCGDHYDKPDFRELDPISPLSLTSSLANTSISSTSSSSSSGSITGKAAESGGSTRSTRSHRRSVSAGSPSTYSTKIHNVSNGSSSTGTLSCGPSRSLSGNICPSGKLSKPSFVNEGGNRPATLSSGTGNYGHGSVIRGGIGRTNGNVGDNDAEFSFKKVMMGDDAEEAKRAGNDVYRKGKFEEALMLYNKAIGLAPDNAAYRSNKGAALTALGRLREAVKECDEAVGLDPGYGRARLRLASLYIRYGMDRNFRKIN